MSTLDSKVATIAEMFPSLDTDIILEHLSRAPDENIEASLEYFLQLSDQQLPPPPQKFHPKNQSPPLQQQKLPPQNKTQNAQALSEKETIIKTESTAEKDEQNEDFVEMISAQPQQAVIKDNGVQEIISLDSDDEDMTKEPLTIREEKRPRTKSFEEQLAEVKRSRGQEWNKTRTRASTTTSSNAAKKPPVNTTISSASSSPGFYDQLRTIRQKHQGKWRNTKSGRKRVWTIADIEEQRKKEEEAQAEWGMSGPGAQKPKSGPHTINNTFFDPVRIGKEALEYTNQFRGKNKLPPLKWHQALCDIGAKHSKDMGDGKVPFGHAGFDQRVRQYPMSYRSAAENVAMSSGLPEVARVAVNGWIDSPGHRKNLLSNSIYCGIGVYQNSKGAWYLTQLFSG